MVRGEIVAPTPNVTEDDMKKIKATISYGT